MIAIYLLSLLCFIISLFDDLYIRVRDLIYLNFQKELTQDDFLALGWLLFTIGWILERVIKIG